MIKIVVDAMGGDFAPAQQIAGAVRALNEDKELSVILVGDETQIKNELSDKKYDENRVEIVHTTETISMEESPTKAVKTKKDSSLVVAFRLLKEGKADGLVSAGSTGAILAAGVLVLGRLKGVSRPALCPAFPNPRKENRTTLLCDCGANLECKPINLVHFAVMASAYAEAVYGIQNPTVGLLNNGTEDIKGLPLQQEANELLKKVDCIHYVGNVEARELMFGEADVVVSDGFTGNIAMKGIEGCGKAVSTILKREYKRNLWTKIGALFSAGVIKNIRGSLDYEGKGGAMFLGLNKAVVKGHGNSKAYAFSVCIKQAAEAARGDMVGKMKEMIDKVNIDQVTAQTQIQTQTGEKAE